MTLSLRFGQVAVLKNLDQDNAVHLKSPNNRILYCANKRHTFMVTGAEDMGLVDELISARNQAKHNKETDKKAAKRSESLTYGLLRFLYNRAAQGQSLGDYERGSIHNAFLDVFSDGQIELL